MELLPIGPELYACMQPDTGLGANNSGFIARDGGVVVDTFWDLTRTRHLIDLYASVHPDPARRVVNTHHNGDHCWGNQLFAEAGAEIIGHRQCVDYFYKEVSPEQFVSLCDADDDQLPPDMLGFVRALRAFDFHDITLTPPNTVIDSDTVIDIDGLEVELLYVGPAHTAGDVAVHVPEHGVVFTGDVLFHECTPIGWQGTFAHWLAALDRLIALEPATVVPGHGPLATVEGLRDMRAYLEYVFGEARQGYDKGLSSLDTAKGIELGRYGAWTEPERLAFQVDRAYREFDGGAWNARVDTGKVFGEVAALRTFMQSQT